jgi:hypothetical protein
VLAWCAAVSLSACGEDAATKIARDPYLPTMMKDPLFTWRPAGDVSRTESLVPRSKDYLASGTAISSIFVTFTCRDSADAARLLQEAQAIAANEGYVKRRRNLMPDVDVEASIAITKGSGGIGILLTAPV